MLRFSILRLGQSMVILIAVALLLFLLFHISGGDPGSTLAGKYASAIDINLVNESLGTDRPLLSRMGSFLFEIANFDFGRSWVTQDNINNSIIERLSPTLLLMLPGFLFTFLFALIAGAWPFVVNRPELSRKIIGLASVASSLSSLVVIIVAQYLLTYKLEIFPSMGWPENMLGQINFLILPWLIILVISSGSQVIWMMSIFSAAYEKQFVIAARARGISPWKLFLQHVLTASSPLLAVSFLYQLAFMVTGSILIESYFSIPGIGSMIAAAIRNADLPVIKATTIYGTLIYLLCSVGSDILQFKLDPKARPK